MSPQSTRNGFPLPPRADGDPEWVDTSECSSIVIIGANGAGKTRFANRLAADLGDGAYRLNALDALYNVTEPDPAHWAIDRLHQQAGAVPAYDKTRRQTRLDRLLTLLVSDELVNLFRFKFARCEGDANPVRDIRNAPETRIDTLIRFWQEVFPANRVLVDSGNILFGRDGSDDTFVAGRLSDGERAVLYYGAALLYAPRNAVVMVDSPEMFMHPSTLQSVWNRLEQLRPDCLPVYITHDLEFAASRHNAAFVWVRSCNTADRVWDYRIVPADSILTDQISLDIMGARKPVLFIEGDQRSIDANLYLLIFPDYTVKSLGSCNKVIEATRTFNDLNGFHHLQARGIVDRDRRDDGEVAYLRGKNVMVPDVAEIENMLLLPEVIEAVAAFRHKDGCKVAETVRRSIIKMFDHDLRQQALQHTRHRVKRTVEYRIDGRFSDIDALERHIDSLTGEINPRGLYEGFCREFHGYVKSGDYRSILRVYNQKSMLPGCNVPQLCGLNGKEAYIETVMGILRGSTPHAARIRAAVRAALRAG